MARAAATAPARRTLPRRPARTPLRRVPVSVPRLPTGARLLDSLLRGRAWIALVGVLLVGIVFFNVDLLRVNRQLAITGEKSTAVKRQNAQLELQLAHLSSTERLQTSAAKRGMTMPLPGQVHFIKARPRIDERVAADRLKDWKKQPSQDTAAPTQSQTPAAQPTSTVTQPQAATPTTPTQAAPTQTTPTPQQVPAATAPTP